MVDVNLHNISSQAILDTAGFGSGKGKYEEECEVKSFEAHGKLACRLHTGLRSQRRLVQACRSLKTETRLSCLRCVSQEVDSTATMGHPAARRLLFARYQG